MAGQRPGMAALASAHTDVRPSGQAIPTPPRLRPKPAYPMLLAGLQRSSPQADKLPARTPLRAIEARTFPRTKDVAERVWRGSGQGWPR